MKNLEKFKKKILINSYRFLGEVPNIRENQPNVLRLESGFLIFPLFDGSVH